MPGGGPRCAAALIGGGVLAALVCIGFALAAATVALAARVGIIEALAIMAAGALVVVLIFLGVLGLEARRHRRLRARRADLDRELYRAAALSMMPTARHRARWSASVWWPSARSSCWRAAATVTDPTDAPEALGERSKSRLDVRTPVESCGPSARRGPALTIQS